MFEWTLWATFLALGSGMGMLATYLICEARIDQMQTRIVALEKEMALVRTRDEADEKKVVKIFEAVTALRESTEEHLRTLRNRVEELRVEPGRNGEPL